jgi:ABC-type nickel/cobalt efflux system permease component RcnA
VKEVTPSLESFWARQSGLLSVLVVVIVSALGFVLDVSLLKEGFPRHDLTLISNLIIGVIAGWLFYQFARNEKARRDAIRQRMRTIADLNHHIRNALQVIRYAGGSKSAQDATQLQLINEAVARIEWALREVLPQYSQEQTDSNNRQNEVRTSQVPPAVVDDFVLRHR